MRPRTTSNCGESPRCPAVITMDMGFCPYSTARCSLVVRPPRERPRPWSSGSTATPPGGSFCRSPFPRSGGVLVGPADGGVDVEVPGDQVLGIGPGLEFGEDALPGAVALPPAEQVVRPAPRPVLGGHVSPRDAGTNPEPYAVDQLPPGPYRWPAGLLALRQQQLQHGPLLVRQISTRHESRSSHTKIHFRHRP
jgi:hypothetical protein